MKEDNLGIYYQYADKEEEKFTVSFYYLTII